MTEKKYMTASEYFKNEIPLRVKIYMDEFNKSKLVLKKLNTHFINKDLLKDKILQKQQILKNNLDFDRNSISNSYLFEKIKSLEEILEMLK